MGYIIKVKRGDKYLFFGGYKMHEKGPVYGTDGVNLVNDASEAQVFPQKIYAENMLCGESRLHGGVVLSTAEIL